MKTSIKFKKFWMAPIPADGGIATDWYALSEGTREGTLVLQGSAATVNNYKNINGNNIESSKTKGDKTVAFQYANLEATPLSMLTGDEVTITSDYTLITPAENANQDIELAFMLLTEKNILIILPRVSVDAFENISDNDLHFYEVAGTVLVPEGSGIKHKYEYNLTPAGAAKNDITAFTLAEQTGAATIDSGAKTVAITVAALTDPSALVPTITCSLGATTDPASGESTDFTSPVEYAVEAADGSVATWTVTVTVAS